MDSPVGAGLVPALGDHKGRPYEASGESVNMVGLGISLTLLSGISNGLFTARMKVIPRWKWENIWLVQS